MISRIDPVKAMRHLLRSYDLSRCVRIAQLVSQYERQPTPAACMRCARADFEASNDFGDDMDDVCGPLNAAIKSADGGNALEGRPDPLKLCGAKGNRTPDLLDANETRYQLRYSP
jgi:hypothetical protein